MDVPKADDLANQQASQVDGMGEGMNRELIARLENMIEHQPGCKLTMVSPFEAECDCCAVILTNIYNAGKEDALEEAERRIAKLQAELYEADGAIADKHDKLKAAREALKWLSDLCDTHCDWDRRFDDALDAADVALAQIGDVE